MLHNIVNLVFYKQYSGMSVKKYLDEHTNEEFWKEIFNSTQQTLMAKNQIIKIEANKLRAERVKLILDNIQDILEGEVKRQEIKNQMTEIKKQKTDNLMKELQDIRGSKNDMAYKFLIDKDKSILQVFDLPALLQTLEGNDKQQHENIKKKIKQRFKEYPVLLKLMFEKQGAKKIQDGDEYLLHQKYIQAKNLNQDDLFLLQSPYWALATKKLEQKELGRLLLGLWKDGQLKENILGKRMEDIQKKFRQQTHF